MDVQNLDKLEETTAAMSRFVLEFFVDADGLMRPLTNSNVVLDFYRYLHAPYYQTFVEYLEHLGRHPVPDYEQQYHRMLQYFVRTKCLHTYGKFTLEGAMSSTPNLKSLQAVCGTDGAVHKLARSHYYRYRAVNLMFGFNSNIMQGLESFCEFNALRKNQLLGYYEQIQSAVGGCARALAQAQSTNKYRDYCK